MQRPRFLRSLPAVALGVAFLGGAGTMAPVADADPPSAPRPVEGEPPTREPPDVRKWYGDQTITLDAVSTLMTVGGLVAHSDGLLLLGVATYGVGPPVVHAVHGRPGFMLASFFLRLGLPVLTALIGAEIADAIDDPNRSGGVLITLAGGAAGIPFGVLAAMVVDDGWLAWETKRPDGPKASSFTLEPRIAIDRDRDRGNALRETFGLAGTF